MNIWNLDKHDSIRCMLLLLEQRVAREHIRIIERDCLHPRAVRLADIHSEASAYLYTYGQDEGFYGLHLEFPFNRETNMSEQEEIYEDLTFDNMLEKLIVHFQWHDKLRML